MFSMYNIQLYHFMIYVWKRIIIHECKCYQIVYADLSPIVYEMWLYDFMIYVWKRITINSII